MVSEMGIAMQIIGMFAVMYIVGNIIEKWGRI